MTAPNERLRQHPTARFAGAEHALDLAEALRTLRAEPHASTKGHRQVALLHHGPLRLVLFAFDARGGLPSHRAAGWVTIHVLRGAIRVRTPDAEHLLRAAQVLALAPDVSHDVDALEESDVLLGVYPTGAGA